MLVDGTRGIFIQNKWYNVKGGEVRKVERDRYTRTYARNWDYGREHINELRDREG